MIKRTAFELNYTSESVQVVDCSGCGYFSTETMTSNGSIGNLLRVHESNDVFREMLNNYESGLQSNLPPCHTSRDGQMSPGFCS